MIEEQRFRIQTLRELRWPFENRGVALLSWETGSQDVDPFPGYAHSEELIAEELSKAIKKFPVGGNPVQVYNLQYEATSRTNGSAAKSYNKKEFSPYIVLSGKRIPQLPAMTRYLAAHEYGHIVDMWICECRKIEDQWPLTDFDKEYAEVRGIEPCSEYGGGKWHKNIGEIIANDFRTLVCGVELDFWPHPVDHPVYGDIYPVLDKYWRELIEKFSWVEQKTVTLDTLENFEIPGRTWLPAPNRGTE